MNTIKLTMSQALTKWMTNQKIEQFSSKHENAFVGVWGIFGHGNVAGLGEALFDVKDKLPTFRGHNEQGMAHAAISFAKQKKRRHKNSALRNEFYYLVIDQPVCLNKSSSSESAPIKLTLPLSSNPTLVTI